MRFKGRSGLLRETVIMAGVAIIGIILNVFSDQWTLKNGYISTDPTGLPTKVGIGMPSVTSPVPWCQLHVQGDVVNTYSPFVYEMLLRNTISQGQTAPKTGILFGGRYKSGTDTSYAPFCGIMGGKANTTANDYASFLTFFTRINGGSLTERVRINSTGQVGIGVSSPGAQLEVKSTDVNTIPLNVNTLSGQSVDIAQFQMNGTAKVIINNSGYVGIGCPVPEELLEVGRSNPHSTVASNGQIVIGKTKGDMTFTCRRYRIGLDTNYNLSVGDYCFEGNNSYTPYLTIGYLTGQVGIGTTNTGSYKLAVEGKIGAREMHVIVTDPWPDHVFKKDFKLKPIEEVEKYIDKNKHLEGIPTEKEVKSKGLAVGEMQIKLLQKIEELTLYVIQQNKKIEQLSKANEELNNKLCTVK